MIKRHSSFLWAGFFASAILFTSGCHRRQTEQIVVTGASTLYPIVQMAAEELRRTKGLDVMAQGGGSTRGFEDCIAGRNSLGAMARELTPEERARVIAFPIAYDGVGIVVHASNHVADLTTDILRRIYRKQITNWSDVGGQNANIVVVHKAEGHATREVFMKFTGLTPNEMTRFTDVTAGDNAQVIRVIANTTNAIGYVSLGEVIKAAEAGLPVRLVRFNRVEPVMENVTNKTYPLFHPLYLISKGEPKGGSRVLLDFLRSAEGKTIIRQGNYVPLE
ncbi:MAG TPA: PstS family phosphate ABC transporter substrate-binding protein [Chthoniobacterales bacterium]|nr:PstS family phosphate ABC transporter substrate-binding protein [Chthoniobacterales bacterium]